MSPHDPRGGGEGGGSSVRGLDFGRFSQLFFIEEGATDHFSESPLDALIPKMPFAFLLVFGATSPL